MTELTNETSAGLRIGAVAKLTGLTVHTLRKWEDRYGAVEPGRSAGGERLYAHQDVERLRLMRRLSAAGMSLRELATLDLPALEAGWERIARDTGARPPLDGDRIARVAAAGATIQVVLANLDSPRVELVARAATASALIDRIGAEPVDVCIRELTTITGETGRQLEELLQRTGARALVVVYGCGSSAQIASLRRRGLMLLHSPVDPATLERAVLDVLTESADPASQLVAARRANEHDAPPAPAFSLETIARVAEHARAVHCECPRHLADLLFSLRAFEEYSADCENRSPQDAALHRYLWTTAGRARSMFEDAFERVAQAEGIELE